MTKRSLSLLADVFTRMEDFGGSDHRIMIVCLNGPTAEESSRPIYRFNKYLHHNGLPSPFQPELNCKNGLLAGEAQSGFGLRSDVAVIRVCKEIFTTPNVDERPGEVILRDGLNQRGDLDALAALTALFIHEVRRCLFEGVLPMLILVGFARWLILHSSAEVSPLQMSSFQAKESVQQASVIGLPTKDDGRCSMIPGNYWR